MLDGGLRPEEAAQSQRRQRTNRHKWLQRFRGRGSRTGRSLVTSEILPPCPPAAVQVQVIAQRRSRQTYRQISQQCAVGHSTVARWLKRAGLNHLAALEPAAPIVRYEHPEPGDMLHLDIKSSGASAAQDIGSPQIARKPRPAPVGNLSMSPSTTTQESPLPTFSLTRAAKCLRALLASLRYYRSFGISFRRVLTDNGACYKSRRFARLCANDWGCAICGPNPTHLKPTAGRALHPDRLAGMGLCAGLRVIQPSRSASAALAASIQLAQTSCQPSISAPISRVTLLEQPGGFTARPVELFVWFGFLPWPSLFVLTDSNPRSGGGETFASPDLAGGVFFLI